MPTMRSASQHTVNRLGSTPGRQAASIITQLFTPLQPVNTNTPASVLRRSTRSNRQPKTPYRTAPVPNNSTHAEKRCETPHQPIGTDISKEKSIRRSTRRRTVQSPTTPASTIGVTPTTRRKRALPQDTDTPTARSSDVGRKRRKSGPMGAISERPISDGEDDEEDGNVGSAGRDQRSFASQPPVWVRTAKCSVSSRKISPVWKYYSREQKDHNGKYNACLVLNEDGRPCNHAMYWSGGKPPHSNMWIHLEKAHGVTKVNEKSTLLDGTGTTHMMTLEKMTLKDVPTLLAYAFATSSIPLYFVENPYLRKFIQLVSGDSYELPHRTALKDKIFAEAKKAEDIVKSVLSATSSGISLGFDAWTSKTQLPFLTVTAHYIDDDWQMHRQLLAFEHFDPPHTGAAIADKLSRIIARNHFKHRFMGLTGDSASNNINATRYLATKLSEGADLKWSYSEKFFHCSAHVFNLVAEALCKPFVKKIKVNGIDQEVDDDHTSESDGQSGRMLTALAKLSAMARIGNQSTSFAKDWTAICSMHRVKPKKLITPAPTRWGSRFEQIDRAREYRAVYQDMVNSDAKLSKYALSDADWMLLNWLHKILFYLSVCSKYVGVTKKPSIGFMIPCFSKLIDVLESEQPPVGLETFQEKQAREMAIQDALKKLNKYYIHTVENPYYTFGMFLDPRFGWRYVRDDVSWDANPELIEELELESIQERLDRDGESLDACAKYDDSVYIRRYGSKVTGDQRLLWKIKFIDCYNEYKRDYFPNLPNDYKPQQKTAKSLFVTESRVRIEDTERDSLAGVDEDGVPRSQVPLEVARFFALSTALEEEHPIDMDPLAWWKVNERKFPVLGRMARDILPMQVSSVETERVHSGGRTLLNWNQSRMGIKTIESALRIKCFANYNGSNKTEQPVESFETEYLQTFLDGHDAAVAS